VKCQISRDIVNLFRAREMESVWPNWARRTPDWVLLGHDGGVRKCHPAKVQAAIEAVESLRDTDCIASAGSGDEMAIAIRDSRPSD
jgi:hypothetical protein